MMKFLIIFLFLFLFLFGAVWAGPILNGICRRVSNCLDQACENGIGEDGVCRKCPVMNEDTCQPGFVQHGTSCYLFSDFTDNFINAFSYCQFFGAKLATIESGEEDAFIIEYANSSDAGADHYFLGGSDLREEGKFYWEDCFREVDEENGYTNWGPDNPNDAGGDEDCMSIAKALNYQWNDLPCYAYINFICEKPL